MKLRRQAEVEMARHTERCPACKLAFEALLKTSYGDVEARRTLGFPSSLQGYRGSPVYRTLSLMLRQLQSSRGHTHFVLANQLAPVDYFVPSRGIVFEFDESQHFTKQRAISLRLYPQTLRFGFDVNRWIRLCEELDQTDSDPVYRCEQRAWYDALRDFAPFHASTHGAVRVKKTVRVYAKSLKWCDLDPADSQDLEKFRSVLRTRRRVATS
jgi:hypothetical protein